MSRANHTPHRLPQSLRKQVPSTTKPAISTPKPTIISTGYPTKPVSAIPSHIPTRSYQQLKPKLKSIIDRPKPKATTESFEQHVNSVVDSPPVSDSVNSIYDTLAEQVSVLYMYCGM